jgi:hypothetical protein
MTQALKEWIDKEKKLYENSDDDENNETNDNKDDNNYDDDEEYNCEIDEIKIPRKQKRVWDEEVEDN